MLGRAEAPGPDAEPGQVLVDLADVDQLPVQHGRQPGFVDDQVAHPEVAVHQHLRRRRRPVCGEPAERPLECRCGVAHLVESVAPLGELVGRGQADPVRVGAVDRGQRLRALLQQSLAAGVVECALDPPDDRLAADGVADQERIAQCGRGIVGRQDVRDRCARGGRALLDRGLQLHARMHVVGRAGAQDQRPATSSRPRRTPTWCGSPRRSARAGSRRATSPRTGRSTSASAAPAVGHLRPNPNSRCATRRIWISSAPSVIR